MISFLLMATVHRFSPTSYAQQSADDAPNPGPMLVNCYQLLVAHGQD
jgi:hypothetical protein